MTQRLPTDPPSTIAPTEAEVRAFDLENQDALTEADQPEGTPDERRKEAIRRAAYERYVRRGATPGSDVEDWLEAEREVNEKADR